MAATAIIYIILILQLLVIFFIRTRIMMIIAISLANLIAIFFYAITIADGLILKELITATVIYSATMLALIARADQSYNIHRPRPKKLKLLISYFSVAALALIIGGGVFYLTKNITQITTQIREKQLTRQNQINKNPLTFPGHPAHISVKKYYLDSNQNPEISNSEPPAREFYSETYKQKIRDSFLFERLSDAIIIIAGILTILLLGSTYHKTKKI